MRRKLSFVMGLSTWLISVVALPLLAATRMIEFDTGQVTQPDVVVTPDGKTLIFNMLGHLFRLPIQGGGAEQLTFGPYYDADPAISPDGKRVAFVSDRDGSESNVFILDLDSKQVLPLTKEARVGRPAWSPDGKVIVYLSYEPRNPRSTRAIVRRISLTGGEAVTLRASPGRFGSLFFLLDGRLAWSLSERDSKTSRWTTRVEAIDQRGESSILTKINGLARPFVVSPAGDGLYFRRQTNESFFVRIDEIVFLSLPDAVERTILPATGDPSLFAVTPDDRTLYFGQSGHIWKVRLPESARSALPLQAHIKLEVGTPSPPSPAALTRNTASPRSIMTPRLTPDGKTLIFGAAGFLWRQPLAGGKAERITSDNACEIFPSVSPDGQKLAFLRVQQGLFALVIYDLKTRRMQTFAPEAYQWDPSWDRDGRRLAVVTSGDSGDRVVSISLAEGKKESLCECGKWSPRPHFSADGQRLYYTSDRSGTGQLYGLSLKEKGKEEMLTRFSRDASDASVSPDGKWLAFRRNDEIWVAPILKTPITDDQARLFSTEGGDSFAFTSDSSALVYSSGEKVWLQRPGGGERRPVPVRLELPQARPRPLLLRGLRVLDFESGGFGPPTSMLIEQGRIAWIGPESGQNISSAAEVIDSTGRFAIPGLFDFHTYTAGFQPVPFIAYGVTSLRDLEGSISWMNALRDRGDFFSDPTPRFFFSGGLFEGEHPEWGDSFLLIYDETSAREYVRQHKQRGASLIKFYSVNDSLAWPLQHIVADEAHKLDLPLATNAEDVEEITKGVILGCETLEYGACEQFYGDVIQMLALSGTHWDPITTMSGSDALLLRDDPDKLSDPKLCSLLPEQAFGETLYGSFSRSLDDISLRGYIANLLARVGEAHRRGVQLHAGTGAPEPDCFPGQALHWELARFVEAGLTPFEVLRMATEEAAAAVGASDIGILAPGKLADVVLLSANPLEDIRSTEKIWRVIKGGWLFDPEGLGPQSKCESIGDAKDR
jgi:Tol biopolymer transport system component